jgi:hypothetical protein
MLSALVILLALLLAPCALVAARIAPNDAAAAAIGAGQQADDDFDFYFLVR